MPLDHQILDALRQHHPAWRLLRSDPAALVGSFLERVGFSALLAALSKLGFGPCGQ